MLAAHLADYRKLVRLRALYRHGARLDESDSDFDIGDYRPQTHALVQGAVSKVKLRDDLPVYRIDGTYVRRIKDAPLSPEEKAAEMEAAVEFEARERGEDDPVARSLLERLERLRKRKAEADSEMLTLLDEYFDLVGGWAAEKEAREALGLSDRTQAFLALAKTATPGMPEERTVELARQIDSIVERYATFTDWVERDDILRDIRLELIRLLTRSDDTKPLVKPDIGFVDEVLSAATARESATA